jgi:hypothetical protein
VATTMALTIKAFDLLLQHFLSLCPKAMALFKFWWFLMLGGITTFNFDWLLWRTKPCMLAGVFLVSASVPKRCLSSPFLLYFSLIHIYYRISFLLLPLLCRASGFSWSYSRLSFLNRKIVQLNVEIVPRGYLQISFLQPLR